jgi:transglutaminase-like putative cysteine protease
VLEAALALLAIPWGLLWLAAALSTICLALGGEREAAPTIATLVERSRGASGWELVARAQRLVHEAMPEYGLCNGFDSPSMALARGRGICWHRALVLRAVLRTHGVDAEPVHAFLNRFEDGLWARSGSYLVGAGLFVIAHVTHGVWSLAPG